MRSRVAPPARTGRKYVVVTRQAGDILVSWIGNSIEGRVAMAYRMWSATFTASRRLGMVRTAQLRWAYCQTRPPPPMSQKAACPATRGAGPLMPSAQPDVALSEQVSVLWDRRQRS